jgi:hypothetical protein
VLRKYSGIGERILLKKRRKSHPQDQGRPPGAWSILTGEVAVSKFLEQDFDLGRESFSNEIDESDSQDEKHDEQRLSTFRGTVIDLRAE